MNNHDKIANMLAAQYRTLQVEYDSFPPCSVPTRTPTVRLLEAEMFATVLSTAHGKGDASVQMQRYRSQAESFLELSKFVANLYSTTRTLSTEQFQESGRQFSWLAQIVAEHIVFIQRGGKNPFTHP